MSAPPPSKVSRDEGGGGGVGLCGGGCGGTTGDVSDARVQREGASFLAYSKASNSVRREDYDCAICLQIIPALETAIVKGCEHTYCVTCILTWTAFKQPDVWCPQCKTPFSYLLTYRTLEGEVSDVFVEEPTVLLLEAPWFNPQGGQFQQLFGRPAGNAARTTLENERWNEDWVVDDYGEETERYEEMYEAVGRRNTVSLRRSPSTPSPASSPAHLQAGGGRRASRRARLMASSSSSSSSSASPSAAAAAAPASPQASTTTPKLSSAKSKRLAKKAEKEEKEAKKAAERRERREKAAKDAARVRANANANVNVNANINDNINDNDNDNDNVNAKVMVALERAENKFEIPVPVSMVSPFEDEHSQAYTFSGSGSSPSSPSLSEQMPELDQPMPPLELLSM